MRLYQCTEFNDGCTFEDDISYGYTSECPNCGREINND